MTLPQKLKRQWVDSLRSGKYPQGVGWMNVNGKFCCLGVLNEIAGVRSQITPLSEGTRVEYFSTIKPDGQVLYASAVNVPELERLGLSARDIMALARMNDDGASFEEIANWIEENL